MAESSKKEKFEFLDIAPADASFEAYGKTLSEVFENAALATFETMVNTKQVKPLVEKKIELSAKDLQSLMFDWLNELIFYMGSENLVFSEFSVKIDEKNIKLVATCRGEKIDQKRHEIRTEVKSATYHQMEVKKSGKIWKARVILDL